MTDGAIRARRFDNQPIYPTVEDAVAAFRAEAPAADPAS
jgi:hypothetical protein